MGDALSNAQLAEIRKDLKALEESLEALLSATESGTKPVRLKDNQGRLSRMDELHNQSILVANRNVTANRLRHIRAAIQRIESGAYGCCSACDEPITFQRLKAYPDAAMCIACADQL